LKKQLTKALPVSRLGKQGGSMDKAKGWLTSAAKDPIGAAWDTSIWIISAALGIWLLKLASFWALGLIGVL
jgi:hypothetical protein